MIILSLIINQVRFHKFKRVVQTVLYAPHFISVMVICGMIKIFLSPTGGLLNLLLGTQIKSHVHDASGGHDEVQDRHGQQLRDVNIQDPLEHRGSIHLGRFVEAGVHVGQSG